jgi:hypothetical protein
MTRSASPREGCSVAPLPRRGPVAQRCICPLTAPTIEGAAPLAQQLAEVVGRI